MIDSLAALITAIGVERHFGHDRAECLAFDIAVGMSSIERVGGVLRYGKHLGLVVFADIHGGVLDRVIAIM